ncbi:AraC family transcriptional regulator [Christensenella intestinihominis]|uniref:AraC family transcriptional regulator n=1 Tax=Christensenella intestinihominis TaxID=1851429 RepID=UPI0015611CC3|nr:AraC family transcriptional regulator [Christensenella intestinihominis]
MKIKLSEVELLCKEHYERNHKLDAAFYSKYTDPLAFPEDYLVVFLNSIPKYQEDMLIPRGQDVWITHSPRYMPVHNHTHDFIEFIYLYSGNCTHYVDEAPYSLMEGDLFILAPDTYHRTCITSDDCIVFHIMIRCSTFDTVFLSLLNHNDLLSSFFVETIYNNRHDTYLRFVTAGDKRLKKIVDSIYRESRKNDSYTAKALNIMFQWLCLHIIKHHLPNLEIMDAKKDQSVLIDMMDYISRHYKTVTLDELSRRFNYSGGHIQRLIKQYTGNTLYKVFIRQKLSHACEMLKTTDMPIQEIAFFVGFNDVRSFQRAFKNHFGKTPSEFRR